MYNYERVYKAFIALLLCLFTANLFASGGPTPEQIEGTTKISADDIFSLFEKHDNLVIIDSRAPADRSKGYIEGSIALPDDDTNKESLAKHIPSLDTPVVFYCNGVNCGRSVKASKMAVKFGYKTIYWFRGGWEEWQKKGFPVAKD